MITIDEVIKSLKNNELEHGSVSAECIISLLKYLKGETRMRTFEIALNKDNEPAFPNAQLPEYQTEKAAGADFFCAQPVTIPSIWKQVLTFSFIFGRNKEKNKDKYKIEPTLVHTGIKSNMEADEVLELYNRSSNPKKLGLILANSVGIIDADYYNNPKNDGEIMFAFYNIMPWHITINTGDRIGQGIFKPYLRPTKGLRIKNVARTGGFGSTDTK